MAPVRKFSAINKSLYKQDENDKNRDFDIFQQKY